jgi:uncharacterized membrane protein
VSDVLSLGLGIVAITLIGILVITGLTFGFIIWVFRRVAKSPEDQAKAELDRRLAAGEISPVEYEARLDVLRREG